MKTKKCTKCKLERTFDQFYKDRTVKSGLAAKCKICWKKEGNNRYKNNKEKWKVYYENNRERIQSYMQEYRKSNAGKFEEYDKARYRKFKKDILLANNMRLKNDPLIKFKHRIRVNIYRAFKGKVEKNTSTEEILGCTFKQAKKHIETQFQEGMRWDNAGEWHIDHIAPLYLARTEEEVIKLNHYTNLQPLWAKDNLSKGKTVTKEGKEALKKLNLPF